MVLITVVVALAAAVAAGILAATWGHRQARAHDKARLKTAAETATARDAEVRTLLALVSTIHQVASAAEQSGIPLAPGEITGPINVFHSTR